MGHVYAYQVPRWVLKEAGGLQRYDHATEVLIPEPLWEHVKFLGKSLDKGAFRQRVLEGQNERAFAPHNLAVGLGEAREVYMRPKPQRVAFRYLQSSDIAERVAARYQKKKEVPKAKGEGTTTVYEYSEGQVQHRNREKAKRIEKLRTGIGKLRAKVKGDLTSSDDKTRLTALAVALMDETYERVGNDQSAKEGHFGVTGWQAKHVKFSGGKATISYVGKSGVRQKKEVTTAKVVSALKRAMKGKSGTTQVLCEGDDCRVLAQDVNGYLKPFNITAKDIRGLHANEEVKTRLKEVRRKGGKLPTDPKKKAEKLKAEFKEALEAAASAVGHQPGTLKSQYLVPGVEQTFLKDGSVSVKHASSRVAIINLNHATDGEKGDHSLRGVAGLISSLTYYERALVQDMLVHDQPIRKGKEGYSLRGHPVMSDAVGELVAAGYLEGEGEVRLSGLFLAKKKLYKKEASLDRAAEAFLSSAPEKWGRADLLAFTRVDPWFQAMTLPSRVAAAGELFGRVLRAGVMDRSHPQGGVVFSAASSSASLPGDSGSPRLLAGVGFASRGSSDLSGD